MLSAAWRFSRGLKMRNTGVRTSLGRSLPTLAALRERALEAVEAGSRVAVAVALERPRHNARHILDQAVHLGSVSECSVKNHSELSCPACEL